MKHLYCPAVSHCLVGALARAGLWLHPGDRILDMGCGAGGLVVRLRELGFEAFGVDVEAQWTDRPVWQHEWFHLLSMDDHYAPSFPNEFFNVVITTQVLEHVRDLDAFFGQAARVLKPGGAMANMYPSAACFIEAHTYTPFYPWFPRDILLRLAAKLGIRNEYQKGLSVEDTVASNRRYFRESAFVYSQRFVNQTALRHFASVSDLAPAYYADRPRGLRLLWAYVQAARKDEMKLRGLAYFQRMAMPLFRKETRE